MNQRKDQMFQKLRSLLNQVERIASEPNTGYLYYRNITVIPAMQNSPLASGDISNIPSLHKRLPIR